MIGVPWRQVDRHKVAVATENEGHKNDWHQYIKLCWILAFKFITYVNIKGANIVM